MGDVLGLIGGEAGGPDLSEAEPVIRVDSPTEGRNPRTLEIDNLPTLEVLQLLNSEDARVAPAVHEAMLQLAEAVDAAVERYRAGGSVHYFGAGTSGRMATLDVSELQPTFSADPERTVAHHAGGTHALRHSVEGVEDDSETGRQAAASVTEADVVVGIAASGRTPWVVGALAAAHEIGAYTVMISSAPAAAASAILRAPAGPLTKRCRPGSAARAPSLATRAGSSVRRRRGPPATAHLRY